MENLIPIEFHNIQYIYSIDFIRKCVGKSISFLNNFKEYYLQPHPVQSTFRSPSIYLSY